MFEIGLPLDLIWLQTVYVVLGLLCSLIVVVNGFMVVQSLGGAIRIVCGHLRRACEELLSFRCLGAHAEVRMGVFGGDT